MKAGVFVAVGILVAGGVFAGQDDLAKWDPRMAIEKASIDTNGVKWIDGRYLPIEGRAFDDTEHYYDRLPANVTTNVNGGVRSMKHNTSGMLFRFATDSKKLRIRWVPYGSDCYMDHMPSTGHSGIDIYRYDAERDEWLYVKTGRVYRDRTQGQLTKEGSITLAWTPGTPCIINLPLYNGIREFSLGIDKDASVQALPPRKSGIGKPVVFYGTSITHGGCCSRPGLGFVNLVGRHLDVPVVNLGFSGSGRMELEMADHLARIDASCYVLDCLWNMGRVGTTWDYHDIKDRDASIPVVRARYEPFIRALRAKRPGVPIVMAEQCDVFCKGPNAKDNFIRDLYEKLKAEDPSWFERVFCGAEAKWDNLVYLPKTDMYTGDCEGTVDGCHPNDLGMMSMSHAFGKAVKEALKLK